MNCNLLTLFKTHWGPVTYAVLTQADVPGASGLSFIKFNIPVEDAIGMCKDSNRCFGNKTYKWLTYKGEGFQPH